MTTKKGHTSVVILSKETKDKLNRIGRKGDSFNDVIAMLADYYLEREDDEEGKERDIAGTE